MQSMVNEYLDFVKGSQKEPAKQVNLSNLLTHSSKQFETDAFHVTPTLPEKCYVTLQPQSFKRAFDNLLSNARRYATKAFLTLEQRKDHIFIILDDNGPGIPQKSRKDVFRPFYRLDGSRNEKTGGMGLGLSIVADIISNHGGEISLETSPQKGLRVLLKIPT